MTDTPPERITAQHDEKNGFTWSMRGPMPPAFSAEYINEKALQADPAAFLTDAAIAELVKSQIPEYW